MSDTPPDRSLEQRLTALTEANRVRSHRAEVKRDLGAGAKVVELIRATPKLGRVKAERALKLAAVSPSKTLGGLTDRQRRDLVDALAHVAPSTVRLTNRGDLAA
jgi:hypothetical protein